MSSLRQVELDMTEEDAGIFKPSLREGETRVDTNCMFERVVDHIRDILDIDDDEFFSDDE